VSLLTIEDEEEEEERRRTMLTDQEIAQKSGEMELTYIVVIEG
jgi:hypothetical protein